MSLTPLYSPTNYRSWQLIYALYLVHEQFSVFHSGNEQTNLFFLPLEYIYSIQSELMKKCLSIKKIKKKQPQVQFLLASCFLILLFHYQSQCTPSFLQMNPNLQFQETETLNGSAGLGEHNQYYFQPLSDWIAKLYYPDFQLCQQPKLNVDLNPFGSRMHLL